ncbi:MAG: aminopeptidase [Clostridia bacterium]|nr:aminopeptidase [Clostridia bacterium]MBQ4620187.1 aminopeptidase [Clostridia bacterium]
MKVARLKKYAKLIARMGANVQKGQDVYLYGSIEQPKFIEMVTEELYKLGARRVHVKWQYSDMEKYHVKYQSLETLSTVETFEEEELKYMRDKLAARVFVGSSNPDALKGVNVAKMMSAQKAKAPIVKPYRDAIDGLHQWTIAAVPGKAWAKKVFPNERPAKAMELLWEAILKCTRVDDDPIKAWEKHNKDVHDRCEYLNSLGLKELKYTSSNGTDLTVGLMDEGVFAGAVETTKGGVSFNPNMPTEECFTTPKKGLAEGIVYASLPLSYQGDLIENFWMRFENGKVVEAHAEKNDERLQKMITMDEGAAYLGECALVPFDSPINQTGLLFYNTLFDENACCHFALGRGFNECVRDGLNKTKDELNEMGVNDSIIHVDFMIGTSDLSIVGKCRDGKEIQIFKDGTWAF